jgi:hypothetical protein
VCLCVYNFLFIFVQVLYFEFVSNARHVLLHAHILTNFHAASGKMCEGGIIRSGLVGVLP